jgi:glycosyltransferase involved in cell wall biosynthesis
MADALVSVVVPTFNRARVLRRAVDSVLEQTHPEVEVLVVDDGSTDDTARRVAEWYGSEPRVRYLFQENAGVSAARNHGLVAARGNFLALLDSDDYWYPWKLELQLKCLRRTGAGMIWSDMDAVGDGARLVQARYLRTMYSAYQQFTSDQLFQRHISVLTQDLPESLSADHVDLFAGDLFAPMIMGNLVHTSTVLMTRERFAHVKAFREDLKHSGEDYDFHLRTCRAGLVAFIDIATIGYTVGMEDQLTRPSLMIHIARNTLKTIEPIIKEERGTGRLPDTMVRSALANANAWVGEELLKLKELREARSYLLRSLRFKAWSPRIYGLVIASLLPMVMYKGLSIGIKCLHGLGGLGIDRTL